VGKKKRGPTDGYSPRERLPAHAGQCEHANWGLTSAYTKLEQFRAQKNYSYPPLTQSLVTRWGGALCSKSCRAIFAWCSWHGLSRCL